MPRRDARASAMRPILGRRHHVRYDKNTLGSTAWRALWPQRRHESVRWRIAAHANAWSVTRRRVYAIPPESLGQDVH